MGIVVWNVLRLAHMTQLYILLYLCVCFILLQMGTLKVSELEKKLIDKGLTLSPLAVSHHLCGVCGSCVFHQLLHKSTMYCVYGLHEKHPYYTTTFPQYE